MEKFMLGLVLGVAGGALLTANNCKVRRLIQKSQEEWTEKAEAYIDTKLQESMPRNEDSVD